MEASAPLDALALLQRALAACGVTASTTALFEACGGDASIAAMARCAREQGLEATVVPLHDGDVEFTAEGSLIALENGTIGVVVAHDPSGVLLECGGRLRQHVGRPEEPRPVAALEIVAPASNGRFLPRLMGRLRYEPHVARAVLLAAMLALALLGLGLAAPIITRAALGSALPDRAEDTLRLLAIALVASGCQLAYVGFLRQKALLYLSAKLSEKATIDVTGHLLRLPFSRLRALDVGGARQAVASAGAASEAIPTIVPQFVDAVLGVGYLAYAFSLDPWSGAIAGGAGIIVIIAGVVSARRRLGLRREFLLRNRAQQQGLFEIVAGIETIKSESVEGRMLARWLDRLMLEERAAFELRSQASTFSTLLAAADRIVFGGVLLAVAQRCLAQEASVADLVAAVQASAGFLACAQKLALLPVSLTDYRSNVERVEESLASEVEGDLGPRQPPETVGPALELRDLWFRYEDGAPWVLRGLDLVVHAGETALLAWPSGAGKSTLLRLLSGLVAPTRGDVLVHGMEAVRARRLITYIPQHASVFPVSILENLRILSRNAPTPRLLAAAEATGLLDVVSSWPMGMDTVVSLGGANVSSGQRQLILFTAAVASESPVVLLDEALAHVDLGLRARISVQDILRGRTVVSVVHDASPGEVSRARVVDMEQG